jgi:hypothetical protein
LTPVRYGVVLFRLLFAASSLSRLANHPIRPRQADDQPHQQDQQDAADVLAHDELPPQKHGDHDAQLDHQVGRGEQERERRYQPGAFGEQRTGRGERGEGAGAGDETEQGTEPHTAWAGGAHGLLHALSGDEHLDHAADQVTEPEGPQGHPEQPRGGRCGFVPGLREIRHCQSAELGID